MGRQSTLSKPGRARRSAVAVAASALALAACGGSSGNGGAADGQGSGGSGGPSTAQISIALSSDWPALNPTTSNNVGAQIMYGLYDRLVATDKGKPVPYLAKSWTTTASTITMQLRTGVKCADGSPLTPNDVQKSLEYDLANYPSVKSFFGNGPYTVKADDKTGQIVIDLGSPQSGAVNWLSNAAFSIMCRKGWQNPDGLANASQGSGPYTIKSYVHGSRIVLQRRNDWTWGPKGTTWKDLPEQITYKVVADSTTASNELLTGQLDVGLVSGRDVTRLKSSQNLTEFKAPVYAAYRAYYNGESDHVTADVQVRKALMAALDPEGWNKAANFGLGEVTYSYGYPRTPCYPENAKQWYSTGGPEAARKILLSDGYTAGPDGKLMKDGKPLTVTVVAGNIFNSGPEYAITQYEKAGITVKPQVTDFATASARGKNGQFDVYFGSNPLTIPVASGTMFYIVGKGNYGRTHAPEVDAADAAALSSPAGSCDAWYKVQRLALQQAIAQPIAAPAVSWYAKKGITIDPGVAYIEVWSIRVR